MTGRIAFDNLLESVKKQSLLERLEARLAYEELLAESRKEDPEVLKEAYEEAIREYAY